MKNCLYGYGKQSTISRQLNIFHLFKASALLWVVSLIYACSTMNSEEYSTMSNINTLLEKGDEAPQFTANTYSGANLSLTQLQKSGPVVLVFIRGFS